MSDTRPEAWREVMSRPSSTIEKIHQRQVHRDGWPDFDAFDATRYERPLRRAAAVQWAGRARAEYGSIHQFTSVAHALCDARAPFELQGALARLITDEVRHVELCGRAAEVMLPDADPDGDRTIYQWPTPKTPWQARPSGTETGPLLTWVTEAVLIACCLGETLSRPMLDALVVVSTEPLAEDIAKQILRDEHLHATFGWEVLSWTWPRLDEAGRDKIQKALARSLRGFTRTTACDITIEQVAHASIEIARGEEPNLGTLTDMEYAMIYYATLEQEIFPRLRDQGLDPDLAWRVARAS